MNFTKYQVDFLRNILLTVSVMFVKICPITSVGLNSPEKFIMVKKNLSRDTKLLHLLLAQNGKAREIMSMN